MKLHESDNRGGITVKTYKEHLLTYINIYIWHLALVQRYWREAVGVKLLLLLLLIAFILRYSPLSSRLTALACDSTWVNSVKLLTWSCWSEAVDAKLLTWSSCTLTWSYWREASFLTIEAIWNKSLRKRWQSGSWQKDASFTVTAISSLEVEAGTWVSLCLSTFFSVCLSVCLSLSVCVCLSRCPPQAFSPRDQGVCHLLLSITLRQYYKRLRSFWSVYQSA